jgi:NADH-quinone oxidoreductase subunit E
MNNLLQEEAAPGAMDEIIEKYRGKPGALLGVLEEVQGLSPYKYLPKETLMHVARKMDVPLSQIYSVVTFYTFFNLKPQGEHAIVVCRGTACHTRRSKNLLKHLEKLLDLHEDPADESEKVFLTTKDNKFTLKTVACFGQCALAPVVEIDGRIYSYMNEHKLTKLIQEITKKRKNTL